VTDFCLWSSPDKNETIGDVEAKTVAYCTKPGHGTRILPPGTLTAVQVLRAPSYILFTGHINQVNVDLQSTDYGGELDPYGADLVRFVSSPFLLFLLFVLFSPCGRQHASDKWANFL